MARRLTNLIESESDLKENDSIYFTFKQHKFTAIVTSAGLISDTQWIKPNGVQSNIFILRSFESLTDWTETCIQEKLDEYHTRYSAWRRVRHAKTMKPMETLYKEYQRIKLTKTVSKLSSNEYQQLIHLNEEKILYIEKLLQQQQKINDKWTNWFTEKFPNENLPVTVKKKKEPPVQKPKQQETVQPIMLNSPSGSYLVIQRLKEVAPSTIQNVQSLGLNGFRKMTEKFVKENQTYDPPYSQQTWFDKNLDDINKNPRMVASIVHAFFTKN